MVKYRSPFSFYGGKSKIVHLYPEPQHGLIIEPFAGAACYSFYWAQQHKVDVWINELDPRTYALWDFLINDDEALQKIRDLVPETVTAGMKLVDFIPSEEVGLMELCRAEANQGTQGAKSIKHQVTSMGAKCWKVRRKMEEVIPIVKGWMLTNLDYSAVHHLNDAVWFIDPPYANAAGKLYRQNTLDYATLAEYCKTRKGQVIVCENAGADWLPFTPFEHKRVSIRSRYQKANAQEVVWYKEKQHV